MSRPLNASLLLLALFAPLAGSPAIPAAPAAEAATPKARADYESRLASVHALREVLRREAGKPGVAATLARVEASLREAAEMASVAEYGIARSMLDEGYGELTATLRRLKAAPEGSAQPASGSAALDAADREAAGATDTPALRAAFARREASVGSLQTACERLLAEKDAKLAAGRKAGYRELGAETTRLLAEGRRQAAAARYPEGIAALDRAYLMLKVAIAELEGGEEVVASKRFATPAEEFRYEQARNDDYAQLIGGLVDKAGRADWADAARQARALREEADGAGKAGDYATALRRIGESTAALKVILRRAGFPIV